MEIKVIKCNSLEELLSKIYNGVLCDIFTEQPIETVEEPTVNISFFIERLAQKKGWNPKKTAGWLNSIQEISPSAAFSIVLREVALWLDLKYEGHIEKSDEIYIISTLDGRIHKANKKSIKNYRNFAAFRTLKDAKFACNILREPLKAMFGRDAQKK